MKGFPVIDVDGHQPQASRAGSSRTAMIDLTLDSDDDIPHDIPQNIPPASGRGMANYPSTSTRPDIQLKRKKPGGSTFVAWPPLAQPRENVIVLDDSEGEQERPAAYKKPRQDDDDDDDDFEDYEDYDGCHDGLTPNSTRWEPLPDLKRPEQWEENSGGNTVELVENEKSEVLEMEMSEVLEMLSVGNEHLPAKPQKRRARITRNAPVISTLRPISPKKLTLKSATVASCVIWEPLGTKVSITGRPRWCGTNDIHNFPSTSTGRFMKPKDMYDQALSLTSSFKHSPGSIVRIIQRDGCAVICSNCIGGVPDSEEDEINAWTRDGSLIVWHDGIEEIITGHRRRIPGPEGLHKYYTVNDVKFDPTSTAFVSSGNDKKVRVWGQDPDDEDFKYVQDRVLSHSNVPQEVAFKPDTKKLAVAEKRIVVHADYEMSVARSNLDLIPYSADHCVGNMIWGFGPTEQYIFASSEPKDDDCFEGYHKAFDVEKGTAYDLDAKEAGDSIALMPDGSTLVHTSRGPNRKHILRLYDVRRKNGSAVETFHMEAFSENINGEVNSILISPDGIYVAIARNDNRIHVYDSRNFKNGKLFEYKHNGASPGTHEPFCGIPCARWAETAYGRLTLISGGMDGCIRLWNPLEAITSPKNGIILAQVQTDIGYFSLGDRLKNEQQLIIGDTCGEVSIFNSAKTYLRPL